MWSILRLLAGPRFCPWCTERPEGIFDWFYDRLPKRVVIALGPYDSLIGRIGVPLHDRLHYPDGHRRRRLTPPAHSAPVTPDEYDAWSHCRPVPLRTAITLHRRYHQQWTNGVPPGPVRVCDQACCVYAMTQPGPGGR